MSEDANLELRQVGADGSLKFGEFDWGYPQTLYVGDKAEIVSPARDEFRAMARLRATSDSPRRLDPADASLMNLMDGDSNYAVPQEKRVTHVTVGDGLRITMEVHVNAQGRVAALELKPFEADGLHAALRLVWALLGRLALLYPSTTGVPLLWDALVVERAADPLLRSLTVAAPYPVVNLPDGLEFGGRSLGIVDFLGPHLVEGLRTESPFWRVMCYYKVARYYYEGLMPKFRRVRRDLKLSIPERRVLPATSPFDVVAADLIGKRYSKIIKSLREEYRNVFAHFSSDEPMSPLNPQNEERAARASVVLKRLALDAIADAKRDLVDLAAAGWTTADIENVMAAVDLAEKRSR